MLLIKIFTTVFAFFTVGMFAFSLYRNYKYDDSELLDLFAAILFVIGVFLLGFMFLGGLYLLWIQ